MTNFEPLTLALDAWFDKPLEDLPPVLRRRVNELPLAWDQLTPQQRRVLAYQLDYQRDPSTEAERQLWFDFFEKQRKLEAERDALSLLNPTTVTEIRERDDRFAAIERELGKMAAQKRAARGDYVPTPVSNDDPSPSRHRYLAYPRVLQLLVQRFGASAEELAAWVFEGPQQGGLAAYVGANELEPPPRFGFQFHLHADDSHDYVAPLMATWFRAEDLDRFAPRTRYITGQALIERWATIPGVRAEAFVMAKIRESRLSDMHPVYGLTRASVPDEDYFPPLSMALFRLDAVEAIEAEDFASVGTPPAAGSVRQDASAASRVGAMPSPTADAPGPSTLEGQQVSAVGPKPPERAGSGPSGKLSEFRAMKDLQPDELTLVFVGERTDEGLAANTILEVSARGTRRRVGLSEVDLANRVNGAASKLALILLGAITRRRVPSSSANAKAMSRLRQGLFRLHLGIASDPFSSLSAGRGWESNFKIIDRRGDADKRARLAGERRTISFEEITASGRTPAAGEADDLEDGDLTN